MSIIRKQLLASGAALVMAASLGTIANAQSNDDGTKLKRFDEIVVTARKKEENIQEIPLSLSAFTSDMIESAGIRDMADIAKSTPGFNLDDEFGRTSGVRPVIRGQSTILGASGVSTFVDGILLNGSILDYDLSDVERVEVVKGPQSALYGRNTYSGAINIITKSPSEESSADVKAELGSFGRAELGGTIRGPISDTASASLHGRFFKRGGPFTNTFDGTDVGQQKSFATSLGLFYEPSDRLSVKTRIRLSSLRDDQPRLFLTDPTENNIFQDDGGTYLGNSRYFQGEITSHAISYDDVNQFGEKGYEEVDSMQASVTVNYELNDQLNLEFINGLNSDRTDSKFDFDHSSESLVPLAFYIDFGPSPPFALFGPFFFDATVITDPVDFASIGKGSSIENSHELRLNYDSGDQIRGMIGGYYFNGLTKFESLGTIPLNYKQLLSDGFDKQNARMIAECASRITDPVAPCFSSPGFTSLIPFGASNVTGLNFETSQSLLRSERENLAIFGSLDFDIMDNFTITAEARYKSEKITDQTTPKSTTYDYLGVASPQVVGPLVERKATFNSFNPRFTASFKASDTTNLYAVVARGDKPGGFNNVNAIPLGFGTYNEETVWAFEGGAKNTFMDGQLILNLAGFYNTITDYQLTQALALPPNSTTTVISNVGKVNIMGLEAEMVYRVPGVPGLILNANYALADSEITQGTDLNEGKHLDLLDDNRVNCSVGLENAGLPCGTTGDNVKYGSIVGRVLPRAPKHTFNIGMNYSRAITDSLNLNMNANVSHESKKFVQVHNLAFVGANTLVNGSIGLESDGMSITFWGRNLTNEDAVVSVQRFIDPNQSFQRAFAGNPRLPREYGVTLRKHF